MAKKQFRGMGLSLRDGLKIPEYFLDDCTAWKFAEGLQALVEKRKRELEEPVTQEIRVLPRFVSQTFDFV